MAGTVMQHGRVVGTCRSMRLGQSMQSGRMTNFKRAAVQDVETLTATTTTTTAEPAAAADATAVAEVEPPKPKVDDGKSEIYIGKGRTVRDNAAKYPGRDWLAGGWAGGEEGLWQFREELKSTAKTAATAVAEAADNTVEQIAEALDERKYPKKESLGPFSGVTGGFAGGELGVQQFVETGDVKLLEPGNRRRQTSMVTVAAVVALAGTAGALLLNEGVDVGENILRTEVWNAPIDDNTKAMLELALILLATAGTVASVRALFTTLQKRMVQGAEGAKRVVIFLTFWAAVFVAARYVLEN